MCGSFSARERLTQTVSFAFGCVSLHIKTTNKPYEFIIEFVKTIFQNGFDALVPLHPGHGVAMEQRVRMDQQSVYFDLWECCQQRESSL